jgi:hypothetical protein
MRGALHIVAFGAAIAALGCHDNRTFPMRERFDAGTGQQLDCVPNLDGKIEASELKPALGVPASYVVSPPGQTRQVDLEGFVDEDGQRVWDWSVDREEDQSLRVSADSIDERWYADEFPNGEFFTQGVLPGRVEAVFRQDGQALWLLGYASAEEEPEAGKTLLVYDEGVPLYRFPVEPGQQWTDAAEVQDGTLRGLPFAGRDIYQIRVDATGEIRLPDVTFDQVHRVRTQVTIEPSVGAPTTLKQVSFLFECFGEVARATSEPGEMEENFETAQSQRRLSL